MRTKTITAALVATLVVGCAAQPQGPRTLVGTPKPTGRHLQNAPTVGHGLNIIRRIPA